MTLEAEDRTPRRTLRLWPGVVIVVLSLGARFGLPVFAPDLMVVGVLGGLAGGVAVALWWLLFSRAPWSERLGGVGLMAIALLVASRLADKSIATGGMGCSSPSWPSRGWGSPSWSGPSSRGTSPTGFDA